MRKILARELNDRQYEAAVTTDGPLLIIAGAGSGKTRTIAYRTAYMLHIGIRQPEILALTFTNKAADEMKIRIQTICGKKVNRLAVSTFHAFGAKILRSEIGVLGFKTNFSIYDQSDKIALIKETAREIRFGSENIDLFAVSSLFSAVKTGRSVWSAENAAYEKLYREYNLRLKAYNSVDFDDLITLPIAVFNLSPSILQKYREQYTRIMVDEFQDTSEVQYELVRNIAADHRNICVVGDDDQSIYSWRGANYRNIAKFEHDFPGSGEIKLERNYRSTRNILNAANSVISNNRDRKEKSLWTGSGEGKAVNVFFPCDDAAESRFISSMIRNLALREKIRYHDFGILVRTNHLTASLEEALLEANVPYTVSGGTSFFQRKEIKDIISYLRVIANPDDDVNLLRIINRPRRGIGIKTLEYIRGISDLKHCSFYSAASAVRFAADSQLSGKSHGNLEEFLVVLDYYRESVLSGGPLSAHVKSLIERIDYLGFLMQEHKTNDKTALWKYRNVLAFIENIERWEKDPDVEDKTVHAYLNRITLLARDDDTETGTGKVNLMTIHAAKGLEFSIVFLAGAEDGIIPHARALIDNPGNIEEERRLFYVAMTRAKELLFITACRTRRNGRETVDSAPSPFLQEIPETLIEYHYGEEIASEEDASDYFRQIKKRFASADHG